MELKRIYDIMLRYEERHPDQKIALSGKIGKNKWNEYTPKQYKKTADELSCALLAKGIAKGDKVLSILSKLEQGEKDPSADALADIPRFAPPRRPVFEPLS